MSLRRMKKKSGSTSSLASLTSMSSQKVHVPDAVGADFLDPDEVRDRGPWSLSPLDMGGFKALSQNIQKHECVPEAVRNKKFNRHLDVLPDPRTRVNLPMINGDETTTYINANYVRGADGNPKRYICAMGPLPATLKNWWRMIWQEKVTCIMMVTGLIEKKQKKCERYWAPKKGQKVKVADMFVQTRGTSEGKGYLRSLLEITHQNGETRRIMHYWYNTWPDHSVPKTPDGKPDAANLLYMIRDGARSEAELSEGGPLLVHCSAGVGRSGVVMAVEHTCQLLEANGTADIVSVIKNIRNDRVALVQHTEQYTLCQEAALLYSKFVQATCNVATSAKGAATTYDARAFERMLSGEPVQSVPEPAGSVYGAVTAQQQGSVYGAVSAQPQPNMYGAAVSAAPQGSVYGAVVSAAPQGSVYGAVVGAAPQGSVYGAVTSQQQANVYGAAVPEKDAQPVGSAVVKATKRPSMPASEYSVMHGTDQDIYGTEEPVVVTSQPMYDDVPDEEVESKAAQERAEAESRKAFEAKRALEEKEAAELKARKSDEERRAEQEAERQKQRQKDDEARKKREKQDAEAAAAREAAQLKRDQLKKQIEGHKAKLQLDLQSLRDVQARRATLEQQLSHIGDDARKAEIRIRELRRSERDAALAVTRAETALAEQEESVQRLAQRMGSAERARVAAQEKIKEDTKGEMTRKLLSAVGLTPTSRTGMQAMQLATSMQPVAPGKMSGQPPRRKIITDKAAAADSKRETLDATSMLSVIAMVSHYR
eukprot:m.358235 g.358235  ORF g.358235 m.358235 type:complete len:766 (+) comp18079_c0_seq1:269-2566(+)